MLCWRRWSFAARTARLPLWSCVAIGACLGRRGGCFFAGSTRATRATAAGGFFNRFLADLLKAELRPGAIVIDPWNMIVDACAADFVRRDIALKVYGRGDYERKAAH